MTFENNQVVSEEKLAILAKLARKKAGLKQADAAERLGVRQGQISSAENPTASRKETSLAIRMIEAFTDFDVEQPLFRLKKRA